MTDREERQHVIEVLQNMVDWMEASNYIVAKPERRHALLYAIASIETDLKYDLLYEETSGQADKQADKPTTKNDVPDINVGKIDLITGNDCETCIHNKGVLECDMYGCKYESTTKNNLVVDAVSRQAALDACHNFAIGVLDDYYEKCLKQWIIDLPSVTPQETKIKVLDRNEAAKKLGIVDVYMASAWITLLKDLEFSGLKICEVEA